MDWQAIRLLILDVDGVLTDGRIVMSGESMTNDAASPLWDAERPPLTRRVNGLSFVKDDTAAKAFCVQDGSAIKLWQKAGGKAAILSGRKERSVERRAAELGIEQVVLGVEDKLDGYENILRETGCTDDATAYVGDDLPDLAPIKRCGWPVAVANAAPEVKRAAAYVTRRRGGDGAVAEIVELLLRKQGRWTRMLCE